MNSENFQIRIMIERPKQLFLKHIEQTRQSHFFYIKQNNV